MGSVMFRLLTAALMLAMLANCASLPKSGSVVCVRTPTGDIICTTEVVVEPDINGL